MKSVISYPNRGNWGKSNWRGNCSGWVVKDLIEHFKPNNFVDVCFGSDTSGDVCRDMGVAYKGLDLHQGNDFTTDSVLQQIPFLGGTDMCWSHPPYHSMVKYNAKQGNNTSTCSSVGQFLEMSNVMLMNQREATKTNGIYCSLIGDLRKNGAFYSFQSDFINMMPKDELISVTIKMQHNCLSDGRVYQGSFIPINHEYLVVWRRKSKSMFLVSMQRAISLKNQIASTWRTAIRIAMMHLKGSGCLADIYKNVEDVAVDLIANNPHWKAKIRQILQKHYTNVKRGVWAVN
ncbi:MAG: hypothetical protein QM504_10325 [Pseudomonadota bacterium]